MLLRQLHPDPTEAERWAVRRLPQRRPGDRVGPEELRADRQVTTATSALGMSGQQPDQVQHPALDVLDMHDHRRPRRLLVHHVRQSNANRPEAAAVGMQLQPPVGAALARR